MNKMKKFAVLLFAAVMVLSMSVTAFAADTFTIRLTTDDDSATAGHEYKVYQLFTGELTVTGTGDSAEKTLANVVYGTAWTDGTDTANAKAAGNAVPDSELEAITDSADAEEYADENISSMVTVYGTLNEENSWTLSDVPAGYYLIVDDTSKTLSKGDTYSKYIVQVVSDVNMDPKSETITSDKKEFDDTAAKVSANEAGIGSVVSYEVTGTVASDAASYNTYYFVMADTMSAGLTFNNDVKLYTRTTTKDNDDKDVVTDTALSSDQYRVYTGTDALEGTTQYTFEVALLNAKNYAGKTIVAKYSATVNSVHASTNLTYLMSETNKYKLIYSNDPEHNYGGDSAKPGKPADADESVLGETAETTTKTYATKLALTKKDENGNLLKGATFRLTSANANQTVVTNGDYFQLNNDVDEEDAWYLLKDGTYTQTAPSEDDYEFVKTGSKGDSKTEVGYIYKNGEYVVPSDTSEYIDQDLYVKQLSTNATKQYASLENKYEKKTLTGDTASVASPVDIILTTDDNGVLTFTGLGSGTYTLEEVDAPDGFNYVDDTTFTISFDASTNGKFKVSDVTGGASIVSVKLSPDESTSLGTFTTTVIDKSGTVLPTTGGIGTTIFYLLGTLLMAAAGVLLVSRKIASRRRSFEQQER